MRDMGLTGAMRGKTVITTNPDAAQSCPADKVERAFRAARPNRLRGEPDKTAFRWKGRPPNEFTSVPTWSGTVCAVFVIDVFARRIAGWTVSSSMSAQFVLHALEQALWQRKPLGNKSVIHHSDRGSQSDLNRSSQHRRLRRLSASRSAPPPTSASSAFRAVAS